MGLISIRHFYQDLQHFLFMLLSLLHDLDLLLFELVLPLLIWYFCLSRILSSYSVDKYYPRLIFLIGIIDAFIESSHSYCAIQIYYKLYLIQNKYHINWLHLVININKCYKIGWLRVNFESS